MISENVIRQIEAVVGPEHLLTTPEDCWTYAYDATDRARAPEAVVFPGSAAEISQILKLANEHRFPVTPRGAGTGRSGGAVPIEGGVVLVLTRLNRILEINRDDLVAVAEPGVILGRLKRRWKPRAFTIRRTRPAPSSAASAATSPNAPAAPWRCNGASPGITSWVLP